MRVGLEDNVWLDRGRSTPATNVAPVERVRRAAEVAERPVATPSEARAALGLPSGAPRR